MASTLGSGTEGNLALIHANMQKLDEAALQVYHKGHTPVIGEWLALPLAAGSREIGDEISKAYLYPVAHRLLQSCDAILRMPGVSTGADNDVRIGKASGLKIYSHIDEIPSDNDRIG